MIGGVAGVGPPLIAIGSAAYFQGLEMVVKPFFKGTTSLIARVIISYLNDGGR